MKKKILTTIVVLFILLIGNPSKESLIQHGVKEIAPKDGEKVGLLGGLALAGVAKQIERTAERESFVLFSLGAYKTGMQKSYSVGILWFWVTFKKE